MSYITHNQQTTNHIKPESLTPLVDTSVFNGAQEARLWIGRVAAMGHVAYPSEFEAALKLRGNVYVHEMGFLPRKKLNIDGSELDADDDRSKHFAVIAKDKQEFRLVGNLRSIVKRDSNDLLPVEKYYPELFINNPAQCGSVEASRFISRHRNKIVQHAISMGLIRAIVMDAILDKHPVIYAVVEEPLERLFVRVGLPMQKMAEPRPISEYGNTQNVALQFDPEEILDTVKKDETLLKSITPYFETAETVDGLGLYDSMMLRRKPVSPLTDGNIGDS